MKLKIAFSQIKKTWVINILLIVQLIFSITMLSYSNSLVARDATIEKVITESHMEKLNYLSLRTRPDGVTPPLASVFSQYDRTMTEHINILSETYNQGGWVVTGGMAISNESEIYNAVVLNADGKNSIKLPLSSGKWFTEAPKSNDDCFDVIMPYKYRKNFKLNEEYDFNTVNMTDRSVPVQSLKIRPIGFLSQRNAILYQGNSNIAGMVSLDEDRFFLCPQSDEAFPYVLDFMGNTLNVNSFLGTVSGEEQVARYRDDSYFSHSAAYIITAIMAVLTVIGVFSSLILKNSEDKKRYGTYYFCGASRKDCVIIEAIKSSFISVVAVTLSFLMYFLMTREKIPLFLSEINSFFKTIYPDMFILSALITLAVFFIPSMIKILIIAKSNPIESIRGE